MPLDKNDKAFRFEKAMPIDANNLILEQAFARFLVLARTNGHPITATTKDTLTPAKLAQVIGEDVHFHNLTSDPLRRRLIEKWLARDFATIVREGKGAGGEGRIANLKPIHLSTIKLLDPRIRSQDRDASGFLYNVFRDSSLISGDTSLLLSFMTVGTEPFGEYDSKLDEDAIDKVDIETLFLLRILDAFKTDRPDLRRKVGRHEFVCSGQRELIVEDTLFLMAYQDHIPRRELIQYLVTLFGFHMALYCIKSFGIIRNFAETGQLRCGKCKGVKHGSFDRLGDCTFKPDIFVDLTSGRDPTCHSIAQEKVSKHYSEMYRYIRSHYKLKKLEEFASTFNEYSGSIEGLAKFFKHKDLDGYFRTKLANVTRVPEGEEQDPEVRAILDLNLSPLDSYVEIVHQKTFKTRQSNHKKLMASLCGLNKDNGFLFGGRGRKRAYTIGNELLEVLVQLAVIDTKYVDGKLRFYTRPIQITSFVQWLAARYGILIDSTGEPVLSPDISEGLETNYKALKERLRELGFFTDLSDASNSQVITPRFPITIDRGGD